MEKQLKFRTIDGSTLKMTKLEPINPKEIIPFMFGFFGLDKKEE